MPQKVRIALDAMGGDHGPSVIVPGAEIALDRHPDTEFLLYGDTAQIGPLLSTRPKLAAVSRVFHTDVVVKMDDKPSVALRQGRWKSSMWRAMDAVKKNEADVAVSAGNTGALMAMARFNLKMGPGISRPALAALWPTLRGELVVLDVGASIGADASHLIDLAIMGGAMARILFDLERPTVGLLNVGVEEVKGLEPVRDAGRMLREMSLPDIDYIGFVEGHDIGLGAVDVVVTEDSPATSRSRPRKARRSRWRLIYATPWHGRCVRVSAICWRRARFARCATRWTRVKSMAACFSASMALSSKAMAVRTVKVSPRLLTWAMTWLATSCWRKSTRH